MSQFNRSETNRDGFLRQDTRGQWYADYKCHEELRRLLTPNGKMYGRKRLNLTASEQRKVAQAIKRARHMALLPFTSATRCCLTRDCAATNQSGAFAVWSLPDGSGFSADGANTADPADSTGAEKTTGCRLLRPPRKLRCAFATSRRF